MEEEKKKMMAQVRREIEMENQKKENEKLKNLMAAKKEEMNLALYDFCRTLDETHM